MSFLVDRLRDGATLRRLTAGFAGEVDVAKIAMHGHSLGGATAAAAMLRDGRILGGLDWDGHIFSPVARRGLDRPFALVGVPGRAAVANSSWPELYGALRGPAVEVAVDKTHHVSFCDLPLLAAALPVPDKNRGAVEAVIGAINGRRLQRLMVGMLNAFFDLVFRGKGDGVRSLGDAFCDVFVVRSGRLPEGE